MKHFIAVFLTIFICSHLCGQVSVGVEVSPLIEFKPKWRAVNQTHLPALNFEYKHAIGAAVGLSVGQVSRVKFGGYTPEMPVYGFAAIVFDLRDFNKVRGGAEFELGYYKDIKNFQICLGSGIGLLYTDELVEGTRRPSLSTFIRPTVKLRWRFL